MDILFFLFIGVTAGVLGGLHLGKWAADRDREDAYKKTKRHIPALGKESLSRILR